MNKKRRHFWHCFVFCKVAKTQLGSSSSLLGNLYIKWTDSNSWVLSLIFLLSWTFVQDFILSLVLLLISALQSLTGSVQGQNRDFPVYFFPTGKNLFSLQGSQLMETGFSLWEKVHRENPVFITGMGLQCTIICFRDCLTTKFHVHKNWVFVQNFVKCVVLHRLPLINLFLSRSHSGQMSQEEFNALTVSNLSTFQ